MTETVGRTGVAGLLRVGSASAEIACDDSMVIAGGIMPRYATGAEGKLRASAVVMKGGPTTVAVITCDILMVARDILDRAARAIELQTGIPFDSILINCTHTHDAPSSVTIHGYERDEMFCVEVQRAIVDAALQAHGKLARGRPCEMVFGQGIEGTVGQNSRIMLGDGTVYWSGSRDDAVGPTGPFDPELPVMAFREPDGPLSAVIFNHSTHCLGARQGGCRSPGFYGLAAQDLESALGATVLFVSGASGSTHNLTLSGEEMAKRITGAVKTALGQAVPCSAVPLRSVRKEITYCVRDFDDAKEDATVMAYCEKRMNTPREIIDVFRKMRAGLAPFRGTERRTWVQAMRIGDVALVGVPGELFTGLGLEIKRHSPFDHTIVAGLANDYIGYIPDNAAYDLGGYQLWTGFHSLVARGTDETIVQCAQQLLGALKSGRDKTVRACGADSSGACRRRPRRRATSRPSLGAWACRKAPGSSPGIGPPNRVGW